MVLYDIWTYSCINCIRTLPYITAWDDKYSDQGLLIVGIHSPEFEFGYKFAQNRNQLGSEEGFQPGQIVTYSEPEKINLHNFYPVGQWKNYDDSMELISETGSIKLLYNAKEVNILTDGDAELEILLDGEPVSIKYLGSDLSSSNMLSVSEPNLYNIISSDESSTHELEIKVVGKGFQIFTYTFG